MSKRPTRLKSHVRKHGEYGPRLLEKNMRIARQARTIAILRQKLAEREARP